ncbi:MAG: cysteine synthase A [Polyangiales bacterium]
MTEKIVDDAIGLIGNTPMIRLRRIAKGKGAELCVKIESMNPGGSVKDRPALAMVRAAEERGDLKPGATIVEATSGNTGISLAMIAAVRGYRCVIVMPEDMSVARQHILKSYGAEVILTSASDGMAGAVEEAQRRLRSIPNAIACGQFENPANPRSHSETTAKEILEATDGRIDVFVAGVGTGGTLTGVGLVLKKHDPKIRVVAVEPKASAVLSGGNPGLHGIQGLGAGFVPDVLDTNVIDEIVPVTDSAAMTMTDRLSREEGLLVGPSSGANVHAALSISHSLRPDQRVVTILCDGGERYLC